MTRIYSLVLLLSISLTTVGQTNNYSRADNNELEVKLVRVFEWVLEARFSPAQRQELSGLVANAKRANDQADLKTFQEIAKLNDLIATIPITPGPGTLEYTDNCRPNMNSKKATQMEQKKLQWQIARDEYGLKLCFRDEQGASACYYRQ